MGKIFCLLGKSAVGKDHIYRNLLADATLGLIPAVSYTTRPMRRGETDGESYHFISEEELRSLQEDGRIIEKRTYDTMCGLWSYATVDDGNWDPDRNYLTEGTLESFISLRQYFGETRVIPFYIEVEDGERLQRALRRERKQPEPQYSEMCRRFLADQKDYSPDRLAAAGVSRIYRNEVLSDCVREIRSVIQANEAQ